MLCYPEPVKAPGQSPLNDWTHHFETKTLLHEPLEMVFMSKP